jgi:cellulose synthase/poly-beta-1,6-N-acetylglucosamine synthase-like glycosyltransferase
VTAVEVVFWACCLLVAHTYLLYPVLLFGASSMVQLWRDGRHLWSPRDRRRATSDSEHLPDVSLIIPAHNEEPRLPDKLANLRALDYPKERLSIIFVSDGSTDGTNALLQGVEGGNIEVLYLPVRSGKATAVNQAVARARTGILVFCDAATLLAPDVVKNLVRHFADPRVGAVCGALRFESSAESRQTEGVYWRYEAMLRLMESRLGVTLTASGANYAMRRECFVPLPADTLVEDLLVPVNARRAGFRTVYDPDAIATDFAPPTVAGEFTRRVRIATGSFRALGQILRGPLDPLTAFAFVSHKLLRWLLPFLLLGMLLTSAALLDRPVYRALFAAQLVFYAWAVVGCVFRRRVQGIRYALVAYYLLAIHLAFLVGFVRFVAGHRGVEWRRVS